MKRFENIISGAVKESMSDIYITGGHPVVSRKNGVIQFHTASTWTHREIDDLVRKLLNSRQLAILKQKKSVDYAMSLSNARLRVNVFTTARGVSLAIRILPGHIPTIEELNLHPSLHDISKLTSGLVLTCGATGVGKTTTIAAVINDINSSKQAHIITLENPIEYRFQSRKSFIQQRELGPHMPSFEQGLIDVLRENPDVIVVGELREMKTMQLTLHAAESGHLVIATLHASSPEEAIYRLCNSVPLEAQDEIRYQIASTLNWIIVQELVHIKKIGYRIPLLTIVKGAPSIKNMIRENKLNQLSTAIQMGKSEGMFTAERYLSEYLNSRDSFIPYSQTFRPSAEAYQDVYYQSPLTDELQDTVSQSKPLSKLESRPIFIKSGYSDDETEHILHIDDEASLQ